MNKLKQDFFESYEKCASRLHTPNIKPFVEEEFLPIGCEYWVDEIIQKMLNVELTIDSVPNLSVLRSMLVMDLATCEYANRPELKEKVFEFYTNQIKKFYSSDLYSLKCNIHSDVNYTNIIDCTWFENQNVGLVNLMNECFHYAYERNGDIFADNTYEVLGPFSYDGKTIYISRFNINGRFYEFYQFGLKKGEGIIDMFGHADICFEKSNIILIDTETQEIHLERIEINLDNSRKNETNPIILLANSRIERYKNFIPIDKLQNYLDICVNSKIELTDRTTPLINTIKF